jgi:zinc transporter ZupT
MLLAEDPFLEEQVRKLRHERDLQSWDRHRESSRLGTAGEREPGPDKPQRRAQADARGQGGKGAGLAIAFGNILDTIPGCLVIGAKFAGYESLSMTLILGMFLGGIPEAAASATMLHRAGFTNRTIFLLWSTPCWRRASWRRWPARCSSAIPNRQQPCSPRPWAGGAILALVTHPMIPEALHKGGSTVAPPAVGGFLFALYLAPLETAFV